MAASSAMLILLSMAVVYGGSGSGSGSVAAGEAQSALEQVCASLGGFYITPELCASALCYDPASSPCRDARDYAAVASLAANATAARKSVAAAAARAPGGGSAGLRSCLDLYDGLVPALEWAAGAVELASYGGARELAQATQYAQEACAGMAGAEMPGENSGFVVLANVAHAVLSTSVPVAG